MAASSIAPLRIAGAGRLHRGVPPRRDGGMRGGPVPRGRRLCRRQRRCFRFEGANKLRPVCRHRCNHEPGNKYRRISCGKKNKQPAPLPSATPQTRPAWSDRPAGGAGGLACRAGGQCTAPLVRPATSLLSRRHAGLFPRINLAQHPPTSL